ncbi:cold-shock protein [Desulforhopalus sp. 52FAK]
MKGIVALASRIQEPDNGSKKIFFHISSVTTNTRRPQKGDIVLFDSTIDSQQRLKAKRVVIEGVAATKRATAKSKYVPVNPPQKDAIDYIFILVGVCFLIIGGAEFLRSRVFENTLIYIAPALIAFFLLNRPKKPKEKSFSCAGCKTITDYDRRTIEAWNRGFTRLYCSTCHHRWLLENPHQKLTSQTNRGECLGVFVLMLILPTVGSLCFYHWLL